MGEAVLRVRADAAQARGEIRGLGQELKGTEKGTDAASSASLKYKVALVAVAAGAAAVAGALVKATQATIKLSVEGNKYAKDAKKIGSTAEDIQLVEGAFDLLTAANINASRVIQDFGRNLADAKDGTGESVEALDAMGISLDNIVGLPIGEQIAMVADRFDVFTTTAERSRAAIDIFGRSGRELVPALASGGDAIRVAMGLIAETGVISNKTAAQSESLQDSILLTTRRFETLKRSALEPLLPIIGTVADALGDTISLMSKSSVVKGFAGAIAALATRMLGLTEEVEAFKTATREAQNASMSLIQIYNESSDAATAQRIEVERLSFTFERNALVGFDNTIQARLLATAREELTVLTALASADERLLGHEMERTAAEAEIAASVARRRAAEESFLTKARERSTEGLKADTAAVKKHAAALKEDEAKLKSLQARVRLAGRSMEELIGLSLQTVQLDLQAGLEAGLFNIEEFERRMVQAATSAQARLDAMKQSGTSAQESVGVSVLAANDSFSTLDDGMSNFSAISSDLFGLMESASEGLKGNSEEAGLAMAKMGIQLVATIASTAAAAVGAAATTATAQGIANASIAATATPAAIAQGAATYGISAAEGVAVAIGAVAGGIASMLGLISGIGDSGITPEMFRRTTTAGHSLIVMKSGETLVTNRGTQGLEQQIQLTNAMLANQAGANQMPAPVIINVSGDSRHMERAIRVESNRRDERGLPRSNQIRFGR